MSLPANPWDPMPVRGPFVSSADKDSLTVETIMRAGLKLDHLPVPWIGDPRNARVLFLALNPGWTPDTDRLEREVYAEENRKALTFNSDVPFFCLDDRLATSRGYMWWRRRLGRLVDLFGLDHVRSNVSCVEWFAYHSATFRKLPVLPSQKYSFELVNGAIDRGAGIVLMRSRALWVESVPRLESAGMVELRVPRSPYVTPANLAENGFERVVEALASN